MIKLYGFEACGPCQQVKKLLDKFGVEYEYVDVLKEKKHFISVPILELEDGTQMKGLGKEMTEYIKKLGKDYKRKKKRRGKKK